MKAGTFELMRVWAALTGVVLALAYFAALALGYGHLEVLAMLVTAIGGFETVLFGQDMAIRAKRRRQRG